MGRARLMEQQRKRRDALKAAKAAAKKPKAKPNTTAGQDLRQGRSPDPVKPKSPAKPKPPASAPKPKPKPKPPASPSKPTPKGNGDGTYGKSLPSNPALKSQPKSPAKPKPKPKQSRPNTRGGQGGSRASASTRPVRGPKEGDTKRTRVGSKYVTKVYRNGRWVKK